MNILETANFKRITENVGTWNVGYSDDNILSETVNKL